MHPNLVDQLHVLVLVEEAGSFAKAAKKLHKSVPSIGYAITNLEQHLGITLFDRSGYRPVLTSAGKAVLVEANTLLKNVSRLESTAQSFKEEETQSLKIGLDPFFPTKVVATALTQFYNEYPWTSIQFESSEWFNIAKNIESDYYDLGLTRLDGSLKYKQFDGMQIGLARSILVVSPKHPLAKGNDQISVTEDLDNYRQIVISTSQDQLSKSIPATQLHNTTQIVVSNYEAAANLIKQGIGWAFLTRHLVSEAIENNQMIELHPSSYKEPFIYRMAILWSQARSLPRNAKRLIELINENYPEAFSVTKSNNDIE